jgi:hypothetical protein
MEMMEMGDEMRDIDGDVTMEDDPIIRKKTSFAK